MNKFLIAALLIAAAHAQYNCVEKINYPKKKVTYQYDLTRLYHPDGEPDNLVFYDTKGNLFFLNICGRTAAACNDGTSVCQRASNFNYYSCGALNTQSIYALNSVDPGKGVTVKYSGGDRCSGGPERATTINIFCTEDDPGFIYDSAEGDCDYTITINSAAGCGVKVKSGGGGIGAGGIILIILVCLLVLYFGLGAVYQWKFKEAKEPVEFIIHREFWFAIPGLVKDGVLFIAHGFKKGDYTTI